MSERPRGPLPGWEPTTEFQKALLADVLERLEQHEREGTLPRSPRGVFYDLRPDGFGRGVTYVKYPPMRCVRGGHLIDPQVGKCTEHGGQQRKANPMDASPRDVQEILTQARRAGLVDEDWIDDTRAPDPAVPEYDDETAEQMADLYVRMIRDPKLDYSPQDGQEVYLEALVEAAGLIGRLERVAAPYGVPVYSGGGYDGLKAKRAMGQRAADREVPTVVLRISDYDDHGLKIARASEEDSVAWAEHFDAPEGWLTFERIALTEQQAIDHSLLDHLGKAEAEGLPVPVMDAILTDVIERHRNPARREETEQRAADERARITELVIARLNQGQGQ